MELSDFTNILQWFKNKIRKIIKIRENIGTVDFRFKQDVTFQIHLHKRVAFFPVFEFIT